MALIDLLLDVEAEKRFVVAFYPYDPVANATVTLPLSSHGFTTSPLDPVGSTYCEPRLKTVPALARSLFSEGRLSGRSAPAEGTIVLANDDGGLDYLSNFAWAGRFVVVYLGGAVATPGSYFRIMVLFARELAYNDTEITVTVRDVAYLLDTELQTKRFAGTGGAEGAADLKDRRKPEVWGLCRNVPPVYLGIDGGKHRFSVGSGPIVGVLAVYDRGAPLTYAASPASGQYSVDLATGTITLGGSFIGPITATVLGKRYLSVLSNSAQQVSTGTKTFTVASEGSAPGVRISVGMRVRCLSTSDPANIYLDGIVTAKGSANSITINVDGARGSSAVTTWLVCPYGTAAGIMCAIATTVGLQSNIDVAALDALNAAQPATAGYWVPEGGNAVEILDAVADGSGCYWATSALGAFAVGRIEPPGDPTLTLDSTQILSIQRVSTEAPAYRANVRYNKNWSVLSSDLLAGVADADRPFFTQEWRQVSAGSDAVQAVYPTSPIIEINSIFDQSADALAEAQRQRDLFGVKRDYFKVRTKIAPLVTVIASPVLLTFPRYGLAAGKGLRVVDIKQDLDNLEVEMGLWG